jgi:hypothetical protein
MYWLVRSGAITITPIFDPSTVKSDITTTNTNVFVDTGDADEQTDVTVVT